MQGAITSLEDLKAWFYSVREPLFNLRYYTPGRVGETVIRNNDETNLDAAWDMLSKQVLSLAKNGRTMLNLIVYKAGKANNYEGFVNIDINQSASAQQVAGIGSLPGGGVYGYDKSTIKGILDEERKKWDMERRIEELENATHAPADWTENLINGIERIGATPIGQIIVSKLLGMSIPTSPAVNGVPQPVSDADGGDADTFDADIDRTTEILGVDDATLARKLRELVEQNPDMAKQFFT